MQRNDLAILFGRRQPIAAMIHLPALPGAPGWGGSMRSLLARAEEEARLLADHGADALVVENFGDVPFLPGTLPPETVAALALAVDRVVSATPLPVGVNALRNDAAAALGIAAATGARFIRVNVHTGAMLTDQGWIQGMAHDTLRRRQLLGPQIAILADVFVKHAVAPAGLALEDAAADLWERGGADALIVTGTATGRGVDSDRLRRIRSTLPSAPLWIGSGLDATSAATVMPLADGAIVGSALRVGGKAGAPLDAARVRRLMEAVHAAR
jgi:uncharacterized protein